MSKLLRSLFLFMVLAGSLFVFPVQTAFALALPAEINKQFTPILIDAGAVAVLRVAIFNPNTFPLTNASWTDNLVGVQPGLTIAPPGLVVNTCGGVVTAVPGDTTLSLTGGSVPAQTTSGPGRCYVEINVTSSTPGNLINTIPADNLNANGNDGGTPVTISNTTPASATLTVVAVTPPTLSKGFAPNTITMGDVSTLTITINNNDTNTDLTGTSITDTLPANVVLATPPFGATPLTNCGASASLAAIAGGNTIALTNATVTPAQNCLVTVNVTSNVQGVYVNTIPAGPVAPGSIRTDQGVTNSSPASATLNVQPITIAKQFVPSSFQAGGTSTLTITIQNPSASNYTGVNLSDTLPILPNTNLNYVANSAATTCLPGAATNTTTTVTLTGGTVPANSTCTITVNVTTPNGAPDSTYTNTIPAGAVVIGSNPTLTNGIPATADVSVYAIGTGMGGSVKSFSIDPIDGGQNTRLRIDLFAPADTNLTNFSMTDNLPLGVTISNVNSAGVATPPAISGCGATPPRVLTASTGTSIVSLTGGTILAGARCRIDVWVTSSTPGTVTNVISPADISNNENRNPTGNLTDTLTVNSTENLSVTKAFNPPTINPGGLSVLTITLRNTYPSALINTSLTDPLPGVVANGILVAPVPNASTTCAGGTITAVPGSQTITMTGGTVPAQAGGVPGICTITVTVQGNDSDTIPTTRTNTIPTTDVTSTVQNTGAIINPTANAVATLRTEILTIGVVKGFNPVLVYGGVYSTMSVQLVNPNNIALTGITFTDYMDSLGAGIELANPVAFDVGTCGGTLTGNPGDSSFSFSGGTLAANSNCVLTLRVVMAVNGNLTNQIPAGAVTTLEGVSSTQPTEASLTNLPGANGTKSFNPIVILPGQFSTLTITIENTGNIPLVDMALTDNLPGDLVVAGAPAPAPVNNCGGTLSAPVGTQTIALTGGSLAGNLNCTMSISVTSNTPGVYLNVIPVGGFTASAGGSPVSNQNPIEATLTVNAGVGYSLGNRVWFDTDNSGTINGTEAGVNSVDVQLYSVDALGNTTFITTQTTANGGYYRFDNLPAGDYIVVIPASEFGPGGTLAGYWSSGTTISAAGAVGETSAPDADNDVDSDDNGTLQTAAPFAGAVASSPVTLGPGTSEPTGETDLSPSGQGAPDNLANMTVDFGFYQAELGNLVFVDVNANGTYDAFDTLLAGATVQLYSSNGTEINVGPDGILGTADDAAGGVLTGAGGTYAFSGLPAGDYIVGVTPPPGYVSTVDTAASADTANPNTNINNNDNGVGVGGGQVLSNPVTLTPGSLGAASNNSVNNALGTTTNPTVDFGFTSPLFSLGNRVWFDTDNSGTINGTEAGVNSVDVQLYSVDGSGNTTFLSTQTTANGGYYRFDNLPAGDYMVVIPASEFGPGGTLAGYWSSGTTISAAGVVGETSAPDADNNVDSDDNGTLQTAAPFAGAVTSSPVTLGPSANEPTGETDLSPSGQGAPDNLANMTVDFGFYRVEVGNLVFVDVNHNGIYDAGDTPLAGATVQLYSSNGTEINVGPDGILGTTDDAAGGVLTGAGGTYLFSGLPSGSYTVKVTPPLGYSSTVDVNADTTTPNNNIDNNDNGVGIAGGQVTSNVFSLTPGVPGASTTVTNGTGTTYNPSLDFGFVLTSNFTKNIVGTSETSTTGTSVAIGEIVTYQVNVIIPPGTYTTATLVDTMEQGLAFTGCDVIDAPGLTTDVTGGFASICANPSVLPAMSAAPADIDRRVTFNFGTLTNQSQADVVLSITYGAIVLDIPTNVDGTGLNNSAAWSSSAGNMGPSQTTVNILEPHLQIEKTANVTFIADGSPATFTLVISHTPASHTNAFDVVVTDVLPTGLNYVANSIDCTGGEQDPDVGSCVYDPLTRTIKATWSTFTRLPSTDRGIIKFDVIGTSSIPANGSVTNIGNAEWSSLPGDKTAPDSFSNPPNPYATERHYDPLNPVDVYHASSSLTLTPVGGGGGGGGGGKKKNSSGGGFLIPVTGFAPNTVTELNPASRVAYDSTDLTIKIPALKVSTSIVGVQLKDGNWDVSWLQNKVGWLNGTAYPTWAGNSVLTAHSVYSNGKSGIFTNLKDLNPGEYIFVYNLGYRYTYKVVSNEFVQPNDITVLQHEDKPYLTLVTCDTYDEKTSTYLRRVEVRAELIDVQAAK